MRPRWHGRLICRQQRGYPIDIELVPDFDPIVGNEGRRQGKSKRTIEVDRDSVRITLRGSERRDATCAG